MSRCYRTGSLLAAGLVSLLALPGVLQADQLNRGAMLSMSCAGCHGTDGKSPGAIPSIAGKSAAFIEKALKDFRAGTVPSTVMKRHAKGYSDEEIKLIAKYFAGK